MSETEWDNVPTWDEEDPIRAPSGGPEAPLQDEEAAEPELDETHRDHPRDSAQQPWERRWGLTAGGSFAVLGLSALGLAAHRAGAGGKGVLMTGPAGQIFAPRPVHERSMKDGSVMQTTCASIGCHRFSGSLDCQCNSRCVDFGNCCVDFADTCGAGDDGAGKRGSHVTTTPISRRAEWEHAFAHPKPVDSCAVLKCAEKKFDPSAVCQCTEDCEAYGNCCADWARTCGFALPGCRTAGPGERCYDAVLTAMTTGIARRPQDFPGLTPNSSFAEFQVLLHSTKDVDCPLPCEAEGPPLADCLCLFDVDRTLTAKQTAGHQCSEAGTEQVPGVADPAFHGGGLVLSELAQNIRRTFCGTCYRGIISNGDVAGPKSPMRRVALAVLGEPAWTLTDAWEHYADGKRSTLMVGVPNAEKRTVAADIVSWLLQHRGVEIKNSRVYFFDDSLDNVLEFRGSGMNAQQVSCISRDRGSVLGVCGGRSDELSDDLGVLTCRDKGVLGDDLDEDGGNKDDDDYFLAA